MVFLHILARSSLSQKRTKAYEITQMHTNELNEKLWNAGVYLHQADLSFSPQSLRNEWEELKKRSALEAAKAKMEELVGREMDFQKSIAEVLSAANEVSKPKENLRKKMRELVVSWLLRGDLVGFGFEKPRRMDALPHQLYPELWHGRIDWFDSSLESQGLNLVQIRVLSKGMIEKVRASSAPETARLEEPVQPAKGRPTIQPQITAAFHRVMAGKNLDRAMSLKTVAEHVRLQLAQDNPELQVTEEKPSYETIRRVISPLWKENTKQ